MRKRKCCKSTGPEHADNCRHARKTCEPAGFSVVASVPTLKAEVAGTINARRFARYFGKPNIAEVFADMETNEIPNRSYELGQRLSAIPYPKDGGGSTS